MKKKGTFKIKAKKFGKRFLNPSAWMGRERLGDTARDIKDHAQRMFTVDDKASMAETFSGVVSRLKLSEKDIKSRTRNLGALAIFFGFVSLLLAGYFFYNIWHGNVLASLMSFGLCTALLGFTFKYHFWYFQMKERKLGCTTQEWWDYGILRKKRSSSKERAMVGKK